MNPVMILGLGAATFLMAIMSKDDAPPEKPSKERDNSPIIHNHVHLPGGYNDDTRKTKPISSPGAKKASPGNPKKETPEPTKTNLERDSDPSGIDDKEELSTGEEIHDETISDDKIED